MVAWRRLPNGCSNFAQNFLAAFAKPLLCAGRFISTELNLKTICIKHFKTRSIIWRLIASQKLQKNHLTTTPIQLDLESGCPMI